MKILSIIVPHYNDLFFLKKKIESLSKIENDEIEIIIVDDGSNKECQDYINSIINVHKNIKFIIHEKNVGVVNLLNYAITKYNTAKFILTSSADDIVNVNYLDNLLEILKKNNNFKVFTSKPIFFKSENNDYRYYDAYTGFKKSEFISPENFISILNTKIFAIWGHATIYRKDVYYDLNFFRENHGMYCDWYFAHVAALKYGIYYLAEPIAYFFQRENSLYHSSNFTDDKKKDLIKNMLNDIIKDHPELVKRFNISNIFTLLGSNFLDVANNNQQYKNFTNNKYKFYLRLKNLKILMSPLYKLKSFLIKYIKTR